MALESDGIFPGDKMPYWLKVYHRRRQRSLNIQGVCQKPRKLNVDVTDGVVFLRPGGLVSLSALPEHP